MNFKAGIGIGICIFAVSTILSSSAIAQVKPEILVKQRQSAMTLMGKYFGPLAGMQLGKVPYDANVAARNAGYLDALSKMAWDGFDASTSNEKTRALPEVFKDAAKFKDAADKMQTEVGKLVAATKSGNEAGVKAEIAEINKACAACHDNFRQKQ
jgi:cytochrome c556